MNNIDYLDPEEKKLVKSYENDEWQSIDNIEEEKKLHAQYAKNTSISFQFSLWMVTLRRTIKANVI